MQICIFEDNQVSKLLPLVYSRPAYDLICGITTLREKILRAYNVAEYILHTRKYLEEIVRLANPSIKVNEINSDSCLFINGRILAKDNLAEIIPLQDSQDKIYLNEQNIIAARLSGNNLSKIKNNLPDTFSIANFENIPNEKVEIRTAEFVWDLITRNREEFNSDFNFLTAGKEKTSGKIYDGAHLLEKSNIFIDEGAEVKPGAVLDATEGAIYISKNAVISANAVIENCVSIGESSLVKAGSNIYSNVTIGNTCKVGGEIEDSIILPFSNKQHAGFIGHSYLGSWVNLGADTNCSDLKNNYSTVNVFINGANVDSKMQFLGLIMGDHSKSAINTMFNTGTVVGFASNVFGGGFPPKYIPSFSWGGSESMTTYDYLKGIETARRVMARRKITLTEYDQKLFKKIFDDTSNERLKQGYPY